MELIAGVLGKIAFNAKSNVERYLIKTTPFRGGHEQAKLTSGDMGAPPGS